MENSGYVRDEEYLSSAAAYTMPFGMVHAARAQGWVAPSLDTPFNVVELACGNGINALMTAAVHPNAQVYGYDFNATHISNAREIAAKAGLKNISFECVSFSDMLSRGQSALPKANFVCAFGVYSWITDEVRSDLDRLIAQVSEPGALVVFNYECLPGARGSQLYDRMMAELSLPFGGATRSGLAAADKDFDDLLHAGFKFGPEFAEFFKRSKKLSTQYRLHATLSLGGRALFSSEVVRNLEKFGFKFIGDAMPWGFLSGFGLTDKARALIAKSATTALQQLLLDYATGRSVRIDLHIMGGRQMTGFEALDWRDDQRFISHITPKTPLNKSSLRDYKLNRVDDKYEAVRDFFFAKPVSMSEALGAGAGEGLDQNRVLSLMYLALLAGELHPTLKEVSPEAHDAVRSLNKVIVDLARGGRGIRTLCSPRICAPIAVDISALCAMSVLCAGEALNEDSYRRSTQSYLARVESLITNEAQKAGVQDLRRILEGGGGDLINKSPSIFEIFDLV